MSYNYVENELCCFSPDQSGGIYLRGWQKFAESMDRGEKI
jgi:hypothetical protein